MKGRLQGLIIGASWVFASALLAPQGSAQARRLARPEVRITAPIWEGLAKPRERRVKALLEQSRRMRAEADGLLPTGWEQVCRHGLALTRGSDSHAALRGRMRALRQMARQALRRRAHVDGALSRLQRAAKLAPRDPDVLFELGATLASWEQPGPLWGCTTVRRDQQALEIFDTLVAHHPLFRARLVAHTMGILLTRELRFAEAADAQRRAIALSLDPTSLSMDHYNLAELTMLAGNLEDSVVHYRTAIAAARGPREHLLPLWGLAVALDRLGEHAEAIVQARKAAAAGGDSLAILRAPDVFFKPDQEIHYYEGLGHEALADGLEGAERLAELDAAVDSFRQFLAGAGPGGAFAIDAADNLRRLELAAADARSQQAAAHARPRAGTGQRARITAETLP